MTRLLAYLAGLLVAASAVLAPGAAAAPAGTQQLVASGVRLPAPHAPGNPAAAYSPILNQFLAVWASDHEAPGTGAIWGRFVSSEGVALSPQFKIANVDAVSDGRSAVDPRVVYSSFYRRYFVAFAGQMGGARGTATEIFGAWLDDTGQRLGSVVSVSRGTTGSAAAPQLTANDPRGAVAVVYHATRSGIAEPQVYGQLLAPDVVGAVSRLTPENATRTTWPTIATDERTGSMVVAATERPAGGAQRTVAISTTPDLARVGAPRQLTADNGGEHKPAIAWNGATGEYFAAWPQRTAAQNTEIHGARLDASGALVSGPQLYSAHAPLSTGSEVAVGADPRSGQFAVFWHAGTKGQGLSDGQLEIWGRSVGSQGELASEQLPLSTMAPGTALSRDLLTGAIARDDSTGRWLVVWSGGSAGAPDASIFARAFDPFTAPPPPPPAPPAAACPAGFRPFNARSGIVCGGEPVGAFQAGAVWSVRKRRVLAIEVTPTSRNVRVSVRCIKACGRRKKPANTRGRSRSTRVALSRTKAQANATIEVRVTRPGRTTRYVKYRLLRRSPYLQRVGAGCRVVNGSTAPC